MVAISVLHTRTIGCDILLHVLAQKRTVRLLYETLSDDADLLLKNVVVSSEVLRARGVISLLQCCCKVLCTVWDFFEVFVILEECRTGVLFLLKSFVVLRDELWGIVGIDHLRLIGNLLCVSKQFGWIDFVNWGIHGTLICIISCLSHG